MCLFDKGFHSFQLVYVFASLILVVRAYNRLQFWAYGSFEPSVCFNQFCAESRHWAVPLLRIRSLGIVIFPLLEKFVGGAELFMCVTCRGMCSATAMCLFPTDSIRLPASVACG